MAAVAQEPVTVTARAADKVREFAGGPALLRLAVQGGGCGGLQYMLGVEESAQEDDLRFRTPHEEVTLVVDPLSLPYLKGSTVEFLEGGNLADSGFKVDNPNALSSCGCGNSFRIDDDGCPS